MTEPDLKTLLSEAAEQRKPRTVRLGMRLWLVRHGLALALSLAAAIGLIAYGAFMQELFASAHEDSAGSALAISYMVGCALLMGFLETD